MSRERSAIGFELILLAPLRGHADLLIEADIAVGQVLYGKRHCELDTPQVWMTASAFHIPLADNSVDGAVCCRLCHHLPQGAVVLFQQFRKFRAEHQVLA